MGVVPTQRPSRSAYLALAAVGVLATGAVAAGAATRFQPSAVAAAATTPPSTSTETPDSTVAPTTATSLTTSSIATLAPPTPATVAKAPPTAQPKARAKGRNTAPASGQQAALAFSDAVDRGDAAAAWRLLAPRSQAYWRTQGRFADSLPKLAQGGYAGWSSTRQRTARSVVVSSSGEGEVLIVTLRGTTSREGRDVTRAHAFPVRHLGGRFHLELWDPGGGDTVPQVVGPGQVVDATVRTTDRTPTFLATGKGVELAWAIDERDATFTPIRSGSGRFRPPSALTPGTHVLTVASVGSGWLTAAAVVVVVS